MSVWKRSTLAVNAILKCIKKDDHITVPNDISQDLNC